MTRAAQVLLIDDNPAIRQLLLDSLREEVEVTSFAAAAEALVRADSAVPDLVVSDFRMPGLSGLDVLAQLRAAHPEVAVMMMASRADIRGPLANSARMVEDFIEKPFFAEEAVQRIRRVLERVAVARAARDGNSSSSVCGTLAQMNVIDLLQTLDMGRKSCRLELSQLGDICEMFFHDGQLVHAVFGSHSGEQAVYQVAGWSEGSFRIDFERVDCPITIRHSTQSVLLEALRLFDEAQRDEGENDDLPSKPAQGAGFGTSLAAAGD